MMNEALFETGLQSASGRTVHDLLCHVRNFYLQPGQYPATALVLWRFV